MGAKFANWIKSTGAATGRVDPRNAFRMLLLGKLQQIAASNICSDALKNV